MHRILKTIDAAGLPCYRAQVKSGDGWTTQAETRGLVELERLCDAHEHLAPYLKLAFDCVTIFEMPDPEWVMAQLEPRAGEQMKHVAERLDMTTAAIRKKRRGDASVRYVDICTMHLHDRATGLPAASSREAEAAQLAEQARLLARSQEYLSRYNQGRARIAELLELISEANASGAGIELPEWAK